MIALLKYLSGQNRTRRVGVSPKVVEQQALYASMARGALFRAYPSVKNFTADLCVLDVEGPLELFWSILDLDGPAPGGWFQVLDLKVVFERVSDNTKLELPLASHVAGFHAWYRMRGGMISVLPNSVYFNLAAGQWTVTLSGALQDAQPLCLFADAYHDLFHYEHILEFYNRAKEPMLAKFLATQEDLVQPRPFAISAGTLNLDQGRCAPIGYRQADRLHQVSVSYADVADLPAPPIEVPLSTPLDPVNYLRAKLRYLQDQSVKYNHCPYDTCNDWSRPPDFARDQFLVNERTAFSHLEPLTALYRATGAPEVYRTARKWYENIARNFWPAPGGGRQITCGDRTVWGTALHIGDLCDTLCSFAEIDGEARWVAPLREALLDWPMHPTIPRPLMDQDAWGNEEMNTNGTYNMCAKFALACWRTGQLLDDPALRERGEFILENYVLPGEEDGVWPYRPGRYPSHHYDMYLKWQLARLLFTNAPRWTENKTFLAQMRRGLDATLDRYAKLENGELVFPDWTHYPDKTHPANSARQGSGQLEVLLAATIYIDEGYLEPLTQTLRGLYRILMLPEVDPCWHGCWFGVHGNLLALGLHGFHVEGRNPSELKVVRT